MRWLRLVSALAGMLWLAVGAGCTNAEEDCNEFDNPETVVIPLSEIWALDMPGTRDVRELDSKRGYPLIRPIRMSLKPEWPIVSGKAKRPVAGAGFAVLGKGRVALEHVFDVLVDKKPPRQSFPVGSEISVVFFSYQSGVYVHLHRVEQQGNAIEVRYQLMPHFSREMSEHYALIPLGKLPSGKYHVNVIHSPMEQKYIDQGVRPISEEIARRIVCQSFSFTVSKR